ncbi:MAG: diguanylate cyclase [Firmicutes bacterium]|nr:diguanylate cyclase [Bacillota bacterium]
MDHTLSDRTLYELALSVSSKRNIVKLIKKAAAAFKEKLHCNHVSILQYTNNCLETVFAIPDITLESAAYYELIGEFERRIRLEKDKKIIPLKKDLYYYGFQLHHFGLLLIGRETPFQETFLSELLPVVNILAQNCAVNLETSIKHQAIETELEKERRLLQAIIDTIPDLIFFKDVYGVYKTVNKTAKEFFSVFGPDEITGRTDWDVHYQAASRYRKIDRDVMQTGRVHRYEAMFRRRTDGRLIPVETMKAPVYDTTGKCVGTVGISRDITERKRYEKQLQYVSAHDQLTGLYNRRYLEEEIQRLDTPRQLPISIIMGDLNGLKLANDVFGHQKGDQLLVKTAEIIKSSCRREDLVARWGGDEFVIFLPQTDIEIAAEISRRIKEKCHLANNGSLPIPIPLSIALGWAAKDNVTEKIGLILKEASDNMYSDKLLHTQNHKKDVIASLMSVLLKKSTETEEHARRLKIMCRKMGEIMGLSTQQLEKLELLAMLHDIGKVAIEQDILIKPGPLTEEEWAQMKKHPAIGYRIARAVPELYPIAGYILSHHERWDGKGYPRGLKGEEVPLLSRILSVADAFDAMTHNRTYRKAMNPEEALATIKRNAGKQFDPKIVEVFCQLNITELSELLLQGLRL